MTEGLILQRLWGGRFGTRYAERQTLSLAARKAMFGRILACTDGIESIIEFGASTGENLKAIRALMPRVKLSAQEVNTYAASAINRPMEVAANLYTGAPMQEFDEPCQWDLAFTRGVLIHIPPADLPCAYDVLYHAGGRYVLIAEYYSPKPREIEYQGRMGLLWARDFAGEMMDRFPDLLLVDYGFVYHRDPYHPQDDVTYFLMKKGRS